MLTLFERVNLCAGKLVTVEKFQPRDYGTMIEGRQISGSRIRRGEFSMTMKMAQFFSKIISKAGI